MELHDRRVKRTQKLLAKALIELTLEKGYETVTIRDITERADVGYATFFRHYHAKDDLLNEVMEVVLAELVQLLPSSSSGTDHAVVGTMLFRYVQEHQAVIHVLLSSQGGALLVQQMIEAGSQSVLQDYQPLEASDVEVPPEIAAYHIVSSAIALIRWWLDHKMPYPPERMGVIYRDLIILPTMTVAFKQ
jgi:AcrR family transcriptional regulator